MAWLLHNIKKRKETFMASKGIVKVIEEYAVHDGPGLRCIVFLKGCMLRCRWCQNPELINPYPEVWFNKNFCHEKGGCIKACPMGAITMDKEKKLDREKCNQCAKCVAACPTGAFQLVGYEATAEEIVEQVAKYKIYYEVSKKGGITISGGEPLFQAEFTAEALRLCQEAHIHTAIESCLHAGYEDVWKVVSRCNTLLTDVKHMDSEKHKWGTGVSNELILENLKRLNKDYEGEICIRIPLIPGFNDDKENVRRTVEFLYPLNKVEGLDLLSFNVFTLSKHMALGSRWEYEGVKVQSEEYLAELRGIVDSYQRFRVTVGGLW